MTKRKHRQREKNLTSARARASVDKATPTSPVKGGRTAPVHGARNRSGQQLSGRAATGRDDGYLLYGQHPVRAALLNPNRQCLALSGTRNAVAELTDLVGAEQLRQRVDVIDIVDRSVIDRQVGDDAVHQGLTLRVRCLPPAGLEDFLSAPGEHAKLFVAFDQVTDPRNVGAVLRSASLFGADAVILTDRHAPEESGALAKAAAGALDIVPIVRVANLARTLAQAKQAGLWILGLDGSATAAIDDRLPGPDRILVLGAEGAGLRRLTKEHCDMLVRIPMAGRERATPAATALESLNVSTAAAVALYAMTSTGEQ